MLAYIIRRLLLIIPTLFGIMVINFAIVQIAPGGPVEQMIAKIQGTAIDPTMRISGSEGDMVKDNKQNPQLQQSQQQNSGRTYRGAQGLDPQFIKELERMYGFDKPLHER